MADQPDISYRIVTASENAGLASHTKAVQDDTRAVQEQTRALQENQSTFQGTDSKGRFTKSAVFTDASISTSGGFSQQVAAQQALTVGNRNLASSFAALSASEVGASEAGNAYVITTEKEYLAAQALVGKYQQLLLSKQLVGVQDAELAAKIALLDAALSTESALTVAQTIENEALATAEAKAAQEVLGQAGAHKINTVAMRESLVVMRELMTGNMTRLPGSLSILGSQLGATVGLIAGVSAGVGYVGYELYKHIEKVEERYRDAAREIRQETELTEQRFLQAMVKSEDAAAHFWVELDNIVNKARTVTQVLEEMNHRQADATKLAEAYEHTKESAALNTASDIRDPVKRAEAEYLIKQKFARQEREQADEDARVKIANQRKAADAVADQFTTSNYNVGYAQEDLATAKEGLSKTQSDQKAQEKAYAKLKKDLGLTDEQIDLIKQGKSFEELTKGALAPLPGGGYELDMGAGSQADIGFYNPMTALTKLQELKLEMENLKGLSGGAGLDDKSQDTRLNDAQHQFDVATENYKTASTEATKLGEELATVREKFKELIIQMDADSALRTQQGREHQVKGLEEIKKAIQGDIKDAEKLGKEGFNKTAEIKDLQAQVTRIDRQIDSIANLPLPTGTVSKEPLSDRSDLPDLVRQMITEMRQATSSPLGAPAPGLFGKSRPEGDTSWSNTDAIEFYQKLLIAFQEKHKHESASLDAIVAELKRQAAKHKEVQAQVTSGTTD